MPRAQFVLSGGRVLHENVEHLGDVDSDARKLRNQVSNVAECRALGLAEIRVLHYEGGPFPKNGPPQSKGAVLRRPDASLRSGNGCCRLKDSLMGGP